MKRKFSYYQLTQLNRGVKMTKQSKLIRSANLLKKFQTMFKCPLCSSSMWVSNQKALTCQNRHTFDIARRGYIHLLTKPSQSRYDQKLFLARRKILKDSNFFHPLMQKLKMITTQQTINKDRFIIADMGTGEGSHLHTLFEDLQYTKKQITGIGLDISKEGIIEAAKHYDSFIWLVADLAHPPIKDQQIDVILNILAPSNYNAFYELLADDGIVIKVIPGSFYLHEMRTFFQYDEKTSNKHMIDNFTSHFQLIDEMNIYEQMTLDQPMLQSIAQMTPLTWTANKKDIHKFMQQTKMKMTLDVKILVGRKI